MSSFLSLPHEILHNVLKWVDPVDLPRLSQSCRGLQRFISENRLLFRELLLQRLDGPPHKSDDDESIWEQELRRLVRFKKILASSDGEMKAAHMTFVAETVTDLLRTASPKQHSSLNLALLTDVFKDAQNKDIFLCNSNLFERAKRAHTPSPVLSQTERRESAKLHCLYGVPIEAFGITRSSRTYPYACSKVYDLRNYTTSTMWGPFLNDDSGKVDWEMVEGIMVILGHNLQIFSDRTGGLFKPIWAQPFVNAVPSSYHSLSGPCRKEDQDPDSLALQDPYNVSGTWMRVVCFLDFHELFHYNFVDNNPPTGEPRPPLDTGEAIRLIVMEINATKIEPPGENDGQELPVVHFEGTSRSMHVSFDPNANSHIRGTVRLTKEGEVRWTTFSIYHGEERWRSEGVQVGGVRSARGVLGNWFDKDFDIHGPAGPTAFWKINDEIDEHEDSDGPDVLEFEEDEGDEEEEEGHAHSEIIFEIITQ